MTNQQVNSILRADLAIQKDLSREIINNRALAKRIIKQHDLRASLDAVISAIRRFQKQEVFEKEDTHILGIFKDARITTRNNVSVLTLNLTANELFNRWQRLSEHRPPFRLLTGTKQLKLSIDESQLASLRQEFKDAIENVETSLSEISITVSKRAIQTKGVLARMTNEIALAQINVMELFVCPPEFLIYVKQKDLVKAHDILLKLSSAA